MSTTEPTIYAFVACAVLAAAVMTITGIWQQAHQDRTGAARIAELADAGLTHTEIESLLP